MKRRGFMLAAAAVCGGLFLACGGGGDDGSGGGAADNSTRVISNDELGQMALAPHQFGPEYAQFAPEEGNGLLNLEQTANEEDDPDAERTDLQQFGYASGHKAFFSHPAFEGSGVYYLGGIVYLFNAADGASGYLSDSLDELRKGLDESNPDVSFDKFETYDLDVADQAIGARLEGGIKRADGSRLPLWGSVVYLRHGRLDGGLVMFGLEMSDAEKQRVEGNLKALASLMDERIATVLDGGAAAR